MDDESDDDFEEYYILPPERKYPPFWPELTEALNKIPEIIRECERSKRKINKAQAKMQEALRLLQDT